MSYEIMPFRGTEEKVLSVVPNDIPLTVTTTVAKGLGATIDLAIRLTSHGYSVAPHIAARQVLSRRHLVDLVAQLQESNVRNLFVIAGDAAESGVYPDAQSLLNDLHDIGHDFSSIGIGGYPEGHASIADGPLDDALARKSAYADHVVTQLCFDARTTIRWARTLAAQGMTLPIRVGVPGAISRQKLVRVSAGLGLGQSARFLRKQQSMLFRFFVPGGYSPDKLVSGVSPAIGRGDTRIAGIHVFTFNDLDSTETWRQTWMTSLS